MHGLWKKIWSKRGLLKNMIPVKLRWTMKKWLVQFLTLNYRPEYPKKIIHNNKVGVNLVGDVRIEIGLGQSMRLLANALELSRYDFCIQDIPLANSVRRSDHTWDHRISQDTPYGINLIHINPQDIGMTYLRTDKALWKDHYNIGFWLWELEKFPRVFQNNFKFVDEIWTPSEFTSNCFRRITDKPVYTIPYYVTAETSDSYDRTYFGLPEDKFLFLLMFDLSSTMLRKNPVGAIEAFKAAFDKNDQTVGLVIKVNNPTKECMDTLGSLLEGYNNIHYITKIMDKPEVNGLISCVDTFVSLHRAEGFGLVMAESMLLKTACIATNWSSNTEFMNEDVACMVQYKLIQFRKGEGSYADGGTWADADVGETAKYMKKLKNDAVFYEQMVNKAYDHITTVLGKEKTVGLIEKRIAKINEMLGVEE